MSPESSPRAHHCLHFIANLIAQHDDVVGEQTAFLSEVFNDPADDTTNDLRLHVIARGLLEVEVLDEVVGARGSIEVELKRYGS